MDALPAHQSGAADVRPILRTLGGPALDPMTAMLAPVSFIRPSNIISLDAWRRRRRGAR